MFGAHSVAAARNQGREEASKSGGGAGSDTRPDPSRTVMSPRWALVRTRYVRHLRLKGLAFCNSVLHDLDGKALERRAMSWARWRYTLLGSPSPPLSLYLYLVVCVESLQGK